MGKGSSTKAPAPPLTRGRGHLHAGQEEEKSPVIERAHQHLHRERRGHISCLLPAAGAAQPGAATSPRPGPPGPGAAPPRRSPSGCGRLRPGGCSNIRPSPLHRREQLRERSGRTTPSPPEDACPRGVIEQVREAPVASPSLLPFNSWREKSSGGSRLVTCFSLMARPISSFSGLGGHEVDTQLWDTGQEASSQPDPPRPRVYCSEY